MDENLYQILCTSHTATDEMIKKAYFRKSKQHHPDKGGDPDMFNKINNAYKVLSDDEARRHYDKTGEIPQMRPDPPRDGLEQVVGVFMQLIDVEDPETNLVNKAINHFKDVIKKIKAESDAVSKKIDKLDIIKENLVFSGQGKSPLDACVESQRARLIDKQTALSVDADLSQKAIDILKDYQYKGNKVEVCSPWSTAFLNSNQWPNL